MLLTVEPVLSLGGYVPNEYMALVFLVQYELGVPAAASSHLDSTAMVKAANPRKGPASSLVTLGSTIYIPSDGKFVALKNTGRLDRDEEGVDVELALLKDEVSSILSPSLLMHDTDLSAAEDSAQEKPKRRIQLKADSKLDERSGSHAQHLREDEGGPPMVGFDLKIFHPTFGELRHGDDIEALLRLEDRAEGAQPHRGKLSEDEEKADDDSVTHRADKRTWRISRDVNLSASLGAAGADRSDDDRSVSESIVTGTSEQSGYRLDPAYYALRGNRVSVDATVAEAVPERLDVPAAATHKSSLLALSMLSKLKAAQSGARGERPEGELLTSPGDALRMVPKSVVAVGSNVSHAREISRGAKSRLSRHGFQGAAQDSPLDRSTAHRSSAHVVDLELEARDSLALHEVSLQFAAFRQVSHQIQHRSDAVHVSFGSAPKSVFCTFQFYTCLPTKTEVMRLVQARAGESCVFVREDPGAREDTPLSLRFMIDCSSACPNEAIEFAEYLGHCALYVDLWDADSLLLIGTFAVPLKKLLRQGQRTVKHVIECDVINSEAASDCQGGVSTSVVADGGPVAGDVVGSVQVLLSNYGQQGSGAATGSSPAAKEQERNVSDGFNWRAFGVEDRHTAVSSHRPRNCTRARPLSESSPQLSKVLQSVRDASASDHGGASSRSLTTLRGSSGACTLTYDEVSVLFKRFQGRSKGTVQYAGDLMTLLDLPSWAVAGRKLLEAFERIGGRAIVEKVRRFRHFADH